MRKSRDLVFAKRDSTVGHWRFNESLADSSGNNRPFVGATITAADYREGISESGHTALIQNAAKQASIPAGSASAFDMGMNSFTIELIFLWKASAGSPTVIAKYGGAGGYSIALFSGVLIAYVADTAGHIVSTMSTTAAPANKWIYVALSVDRVANQMSLFIDGVRDAGSPVSIAAVTGNVNPSSDALVLGFTGAPNEGLFDEVMICKGEALTAAAVADRYRGRYNQTHDSDPFFMLQFLPAINQRNADLQQFFRPFVDAYQELRGESGGIGALMNPVVAPNRLLDLIATNLGFELIPSAYASVAERRKMLRWVVWMTERKGTLAALAKLIELTGFTANIAEDYSQWIPFITNQQRLFGRRRFTVDAGSDDFSSGVLTAWDSPAAGTWSVANRKLKGTGNGSDSAANALLRTIDKRDFYISTIFEVVSGFAVNREFGIYLEYASLNSWIRLELATNGSNVDQLIIRRNENGVITAIVLADVSDVNHDVGRHSLWAYVNTDSGYFAVGVDGVCRAVVENAFVFAAERGTKKGLWVNDDLAVAFDEFTTETITWEYGARLIATNTNDKTIKVELVGTPPNSSERIEWLRRVVADFIPADIRLNWIVRPAAATMVVRSVNPTVIP